MICFAESSSTSPLTIFFQRALLVSFNANSIELEPAICCSTVIQPDSFNTNFETTDESRSCLVLWLKEDDNFSVSMVSVFSHARSGRSFPRRFDLILNQLMKFFYFFLTLNLPRKLFKIGTDCIRDIYSIAFERFLRLLLYSHTYDFGQDFVDVYRV